MKKNIIFGSSSLIGQSLKNLINKKKKKYIFYSNTDNRFKKFNLNFSLKNFPIKEVDICFFFASPKILKKNFTNNNFKKEYIWLKNVITNIKISKIIYISSSSVYCKNHIIGLNKKKCENYIIKNKKLFTFYQIWRPFNLVGRKYVESDHFHNFLFRKMFIEKKKKSTFTGNLYDKRGYSDVNHFSKVINYYSKKKLSFIKNYGNRDLISILKIIKLYNIYYNKINGRNFKYEFKSKKTNISRVPSKKNTVFYNKKSLKILKKNLIRSINEKKMQHL